MTWLLVIAGLVLGGGIVWFLSRRSALREGAAQLRAARAEATSLIKQAERDAQSVRHRAEAQAREEGLAMLETAEKELLTRFQALGRREEQIARHEGVAEAEA